jgi:hypothetical protein
MEKGAHDAEDGHCPPLELCSDVAEGGQHEEQIHPGASEEPEDGLEVGCRRPEGGGGAASNSSFHRVPQAATCTHDVADDT